MLADPGEHPLALQIDHRLGALDRAIARVHQGAASSGAPPPPAPPIARFARSRPTMTSRANAPVAQLPTAPPIPAASSLLMPSPSSGATVMLKPPSAPQIAFNCPNCLGLLIPDRFLLLLGLMGWNGTGG